MKFPCVRRRKGVDISCESWSPRRRQRWEAQRTHHGGSRRLQLVTGRRCHRRKQREQRTRWSGRRRHARRRICRQQLHERSNKCCGGQRRPANSGRGEGPAQDELWGTLRGFTNESDLPTRGRHGTKRGYETSAYEGTYCAYTYGGKEPPNGAYSNGTGTKN